MVNKPGEGYAFYNYIKAWGAGRINKIRQWSDVVSGIEDGSLRPGEKTPVRGMPVWATPEVVRGGFATGRYAAGGAVLPHEKKMAKALGVETSDVAPLRTALNMWHMTEEGMEALRAQAASGKFRADLPEETALLVVALLQQDDPESAGAILSEISPFFDRLRFYPVPLDEVQPVSGVYVRTTAEIREGLAELRPSRQIVVQHNTLTRWLPLSDRLMDLLADHEPGSRAWPLRARKWLRDYDEALAHPTARRWTKQGGQFQRARRALVDLLEGRPAPHVPTLLARHRAKYGTDAERQAFREAQRAQDVEVWHDVIGRIVAKRLAALPQGVGISEPDKVAGPVTPGEARDGAPAGAALSRTIAKRLKSASMAPVDQLVEEGLISSPEVLARVLPQITAELFAEGLASDAEKRVAMALYRAFGNRRSLLLLNLQSQTRIGALPWARALMARREKDQRGDDIAKLVLTELVRLCLTHFPHVAFPNRLIEEFHGLGKQAGLKIPFTKEIAADIFMGQFSSTYHAAAEIALARYSDTLYGVYYDLPDRVTLAEFSNLCKERSGVSAAMGWSVSSNGMIIEQQQILTTHNLAQVLAGLDLSDLTFDAMAIRCFEWICRRQQSPAPDWQANLQMTKNTAYAWRQMIVFLSELSIADQRRVFAHLTAMAERQSVEFQDRFAPALRGLADAIEGQRPPEHRVFLGWAKGQHPFAPQ